MFANGKVLEFSDLNPKRFMVAGDTHGDMEHMEKVFRWCNRFHVDVVLVVGDFGFVWPNTKPGRRRDPMTGRRIHEYVGYPADKTRLDTLDRLAVRADKMVLWLDGNHEDFDRMERLGAYPDSDEPVRIASNVIYLPRGFAWAWNGVSFMTVGGAFSVDHGGRTHGTEWWPQETIKTQDLFRIEEDVEKNGGVDVMFTHDCPEGVPELEEFLHGHKILGMSRHEGEGYKLDRASRSNRVALASICEVVDPSMLIHGHYHHAYYGNWRNSKTDRDVRIVGLDRNKQGNNSCMVFNTEAFLENDDYRGGDS